MDVSGLQSINRARAARSEYVYLPDFEVRERPLDRERSGYYFRTTPGGGHSKVPRLGTEEAACDPAY